MFAARVPGAELAGLPQLPVTGLREADARALLESALVGTLDSRAKELIIAEAHGNPLALLELPRGLTPEQLAGGFWLPGADAAGRPDRGRASGGSLTRCRASPGGCSR